MKIQSAIQVPLSKGFFAHVDFDKAEQVFDHEWSLRRCGSNHYAVTRIDKSIVYLHRFLLSPEKNQEVDHVDGDGLNNRISNLRLCTKQQNLLNRKKQKNNTSGYKGVSKSGNKWDVRISVNKKSIFVGLFDDLIEAAKAYNCAAIKYHGKFARLNIL